MGARDTDADTTVEAERVISSPKYALSRYHYHTLPLFTRLSIQSRASGQLGNGMAVNKAVAGSANSTCVQHFDNWEPPFAPECFRWRRLLSQFELSGGFLC